MAHSETLIDLPSQPKNTPWPTDAWPEGPLGADVNAAALDGLITRALGNPDDLRIYFRANNTAFQGSAFDHYPDAALDEDAAASERSLWYTTTP